MVVRGVVFRGHSLYIVVEKRVQKGGDLPALILRCRRCEMADPFYQYRDTGMHECPARPPLWPGHVRSKVKS